MLKLKKKSELKYPSKLLDSRLEKPLISIIIPSYNQAKYLEDAIRSVLDQNYNNLQIIVMDGGSDDGSIDIIKNYEDKIHYWKSERDKGQADAINKGFKMSSGQIICWLNSDDLLFPNALNNVVKVYNENPEGNIFFGNCATLDIGGKFKETKQTKEYDWKSLLLGKSLGQPAVFMRNDILKEIGYLDASLTYALDWAYFLKAFYIYGRSKTVHINETLAISREYDDTKTRTGLAAKGQERRNILELYFNSFLAGEKSFRNKAIAGTYLVQTADEFLAGKVGQAIKSAFYSFCYSPDLTLSKIKSLNWLLKENKKRSIKG